MVNYNGIVIPSSSKFDNLTELVQRLDGISVANPYRSPELIRRGLFTPEFSGDRKIVYVRGLYFGAQVIHHF